MRIAPLFAERAARPYAAVRTRVLRPAIAAAVPAQLTVVSRFLDQHGIAAAGPPLVRYLVVDYGDAEVEIDIGFPVGTHAIPSDERVRLAVLPAGRWATLVHRGAHDELVHSTAALLDAAAEAGVEWADEDDHGITRWAGRVEHYLVGPPREPDPTKWRTEIAILVRTPAVSGGRRHGDASPKTQSM